MASFGIGAKLRQERVGRGLTIDDIARETRIKPRFLEAIEAEDFDSLPGAVFARNFVKQFALSLRLDPDPLVAGLPKPEELAMPLPVPPQRSRSSYETDRRIYSAGWLLVAVLAGFGAWYHFNHSGEAHVPNPAPVQTAEAAAPKPATAAPAPQLPPAKQVASPAAAPAVQVVISAHQPVWVQVAADGKTVFTGTLQPDETKQIDAAEQVKLIAGNAGGLTVSLNGKQLEPLGPSGQVRVLRLTAAGPEFLPRGPQSGIDPLDPL